VGDEWDAYDFYDEPPEEQRPRDSAIDEAKGAIVRLLEKRRREVLYGRQLEILLEREFFHWITDFGLRELIEERRIGREKVELEKGSAVRVQFMFHPSHRYRKRQIKRGLEIIRAFSKIAGACGHYAEVLFKLAFLKRGFTLEGEDTRQHAGRMWKRSQQNLDFIMQRDGVVYGAEVKNRLDYIERGELDRKLELCAYLGVRPLFIMRGAAKSYNNKVIEAGGFALIFGSQIYPPGQEELVEAMRKELDLPAVCSGAIPDGTIDRFVKWHEKELSK